MKIDFLKIISEGGWVFQQIYPSFISQINKKMPDATIPEGPFRVAAFYKALKTVPVFDFSASTMLSEKIKLIDKAPKNLDSSVLNRVEPELQFSGLNQSLNEKLMNSLGILKEKYPVAYFQLDTFINHIFIVNSKKFGGASHPHFLGGVFISVKHLEQSTHDDIVLSFIHEMAHQELFLLNLTDRLVLASSDYSLAHASYQGIDRPVIGRLHSAYAMFRMLQADPSIIHKGTLLINKLKQTLSTFKQNEVTEFAYDLLKTIKNFHSISDDDD